MRKIVSIVLSLLLVMSMPLQAMAADYYLEDGSVTVTAEENKPQTVTQGSTTTEDAAPVITQRDNTQATSNTVTITGGGEANVEIKDVNIEAPSLTPAIEVTGGTDASLTITGTNTVQGGRDAAGVEVESGNSITIDGTGSLEAAGGNSSENKGGSAGIGGGIYQGSGEVTIHSGTVIANGGDGQNGGAGIGGGDDGNGGKTTIVGGHVTANGGDGSCGGAGIGGGVHANGGETNIYGGTVIANGGDGTSGGGAGIGGGGRVGSLNGTSGGTTNIYGGNVTATAGTSSNSNVQPAADIGGGSGATTGPGTLNHEGGTLTTSTGTEVKPDLPIPEELLPPKPAEPAPEPQPEPQTYAEPTPEPEKVTPAAPSFWDRLLWQVNSAEEGSTLTIDLGSYTYIANTIVKAAQKRDITLIIQWDGGEDITLQPTDEIDLTMWRVELAEL